ncbi:MAG: ketoacyl-ACP synthase III [Magnetococcales bacterium]|nr:ketoacyl-ACP synthase III [Magnetococcales bacterium]MBF0148646.1 ketoacyl-ACP synthase III [Magnetococcales bacterium]MBF0630888.1 ketoacyl-ACP synthase III [Magnetococcales bacterium]
MNAPRARIIGTGSYLPEKRMTNEELAKIVDTTSEWISSRTGILERHIAAEEEMTSDLATHAGRRALEAAGCAPEDLDLIICATSTPDLVFPATAAIVQHKIGAHNAKAPAFDIQAVCTGFIYALSIADQFVRSGMSKKVLVVGAETFTRILDWEDRTTCILFGDGAGAVVLDAVEEGGSRGILSTHMHADGSHVELLHVTGGISKGRPRGFDVRHEALGFVDMQGNEVFKQAVKAMGAVAEEALAANGMTVDNVDWLIPHQANKRILQATAKRIGIPEERVIVTVDHHGNTSAASVPLALDEAVRDGRIQPNQIVLLDAFGGGFTWASALLRW